LLIGKLSVKAVLKLLEQLINLTLHLPYLDKFNIRVLFKQVIDVNNIVRKLKGLDIPDLLQAVKNKKLPK
jgi:hypothetical protein